MEYETKLTNDQWLGGQQPGAADREALETMTGAPCVKTHPHTFAWWCLASKFMPAVRASWTAGAAKTAAKPAAAKKVEEKKPAADDCDDLFGEETEEDKAAAAEAKKKAEEAKAKKAKPTVIAKSIIVWEVKPYSSDINLDYLGSRILAIKMDGLVWKTEFKKEPVAFGVFKIIIGAVVEDLKVSTDQVEDAILALENENPVEKKVVEKVVKEATADDEEEEEEEEEDDSLLMVQSVDIQSFNKI
jgi:elongation factor 1-beta